MPGLVRGDMTNSPRVSLNLPDFPPELPRARNPIPNFVVRMQPINRWINTSPASEPVSLGAKRAIRARLAPLQKLLRQGAKKGFNRAECIHQLRVFSRRADAALRVFAPLLPRKRSKKLAKKLRAVRQTSGRARDIDVLLTRLREWSLLNPSAGRESLEVFAKSRRNKIQRKINKKLSGLMKWDFSRNGRQLNRKVRWRDPNLAEPDYGEMAKVWLKQVVEEFVLASQADLTDLQKLHKFRIAGKALRYSLELLANAFELETIANLYREIVDLQDQMGRMVDHFRAHAICTDWAKRTKDSRLRSLIAEFQQQEEQSLLAARRAFLDVWIPEKMIDLQNKIEQLLKISASRN